MIPIGYVITTEKDNHINYLSNEGLWVHEVKSALWHHLFEDADRALFNARHHHKVPCKLYQIILQEFGK